MRSQREKRTKGAEENKRTTKREQKENRMIVTGTGHKEEELDEERENTHALCVDVQRGMHEHTHAVRLASTMGGGVGGGRQSRGSFLKRRHYTSM
jgi:hypothetical protein